MKKIIALCLSVVLVLSMSVSVFAADESAGMGESTIYAHIYSSYTFNIPSSIDVESGEGLSVTISNPDIETNKSVVVEVANLQDGYIPLYKDGDTSQEGFVKAKLYNEKSEDVASGKPLAFFNYNGTETTKHFRVEIDRNQQKAGYYSGIMVYSFSCVDGFFN